MWPVWGWAWFGAFAACVSVGVWRTSDWCVVLCCVARGAVWSVRRWSARWVLCGECGVVCGAWWVWRRGAVAVGEAWGAGGCAVVGLGALWCLCVVMWCVGGGLWWCCVVCVV